MEIITQKTQNSKRYLPHEISTKIHAVETYRQTGDVSYICRKYHVSKASLIAGISSMTAQGNHSRRNLTNRIQHILTATLNRKSNGLKTIIEEIQTSPYASYMASCERIKHIHAIPARFIVCLSGSDSAKRLNLQRKKVVIWANMIHRQKSVRSGSLT